MVNFMKILCLKIMPGLKLCQGLQHTFSLIESIHQLFKISIFIFKNCEIWKLAAKF